ncbi:hypothetical protein LPJ59_006467, partial [Coemansia sp. RSA 2399]
MPAFPSRSPLSDSQQRLLEQVVDELTVSDKQLSAVLRQMYGELARNGTWFHSEQQAVDVTVIDCRRKAQGTALAMAIDASGKRIRINSTHFTDIDGGEQKLGSSATQVFIPPANVRNSVSDFFEFSAFCISEYINTHGPIDSDGISGDAPMPLGVSIGLPISTQNSQPSSQDASSPRTPLSCTITEVSKEDTLDLGDRDVARHLYDAVLRNHLPVRITSVTNNVVSSLVAAQFSNNTT